MDLGKLKKAPEPHFLQDCFQPGVPAFLCTKGLGGPQGKGQDQGVCVCWAPPGSSSACRNVSPQVEVWVHAVKSSSSPTGESLNKGQPLPRLRFLPKGARLFAPDLSQSSSRFEQAKV